MNTHTMHGTPVREQTTGVPPVVLKTILIIGGTGVFGRRLADHLAAQCNVRLIVTSRDAGKARTFAQSLQAKYKDVDATGLALETKSGLANTLKDIRPYLVIDATGPFQGSGYEVPHAALGAGAHCIDLADARDYLAGYRSELDQLAREKGCVARSGASSTPALSSAVVKALTQNWKSIDTVDICITPGGRVEVGRAVVQAVLSYAGKPVPVWSGGRLVERFGWSGARHIDVPGLGSRHVALVETHDAELIGPGFAVTDRVAYFAGLENPVEQHGMECIGWLVQKGLPLRASGIAPLLHMMRRVTRIGMSDAGGMLVKVTGKDEAGKAKCANWSLLAENGNGPVVPTLAASAIVRKLLNGAIEPGAGLAGDVLTLDDIEAEMTRYAIGARRSEHSL
ncbi:MAG: KR domain-containing protein [Hyphomicrobiales bacterium]|nr:KR domain-containing protein [Hyphomicrobiales bacterium]